MKRFPLDLIFRFQDALFVHLKHGAIPKPSNPTLRSEFGMSLIISQFQINLHDWVILKRIMFEDWILNFLPFVSHRAIYRSI